MSQTNDRNSSQLLSVFLDPVFPFFAVEVTNGVNIFKIGPVLSESAVGCSVIPLGVCTQSVFVL